MDKIMSNAIETRGLTYRLGKSFEIDDLDLNVPSGSIYGFLGPNGAGKTTTIQLLLALRRLRDGAITVLGRRVPTEITEVLARTGYVPERQHLHPSLTVDESLRFHAAFYKTWDSKAAEELLHQFDLDRERRINRLSKGETGKLMILLALAQRPELLVLDEPTDGLDPVARRDSMAAVIDYVSAHGATVFISSHLVHEVERMCDWVGVMDQGKLVVEMETDAFKRGIKRLRVADVPAALDDTPFVTLSRQTDGVTNTELWVVRGWTDGMRDYFGRMGATLKEVMDVDLEEGFVELLRTFRAERA